MPSAASGYDHPIEFHDATRKFAGELVFLRIGLHPSAAENGDLADPLIVAEYI